MYIIETNALTKQYQGIAALREVTLALEPGKIYGLVGNNGAGKTTLFRILAGLVFPTAGSFALFGETTEKGLNQAREKIGFLIESPIYYSSMSAKDNSALSASG